MTTPHPSPVTLSPDGRYWWNGAAWVPVPAAATPGWGAPGVAGVGAMGGYAAPAAQPILSYDGLYWWDGVAWRPVGSAAPPLRRTSKPAKGAWIATAGALALVLGAFLPWATLDIGFGSASRSGIEGGDGWFFVGGAVAITVVAQFAIRGLALVRIATALLVLSALSGALLGYEWHDVTRLGQSDPSNPIASALGGLIHPGAGLYVLAAGTLAVLVGAALELGRAREAAPV